MIAEESGNVTRARLHRLTVAAYSSTSPGIHAVDIVVCRPHHGHLRDSREGLYSYLPRRTPLSIVKEFASGCVRQGTLGAISVRWPSRDSISHPLLTDSNVAVPTAIYGGNHSRARSKSQRPKTGLGHRHGHRLLHGPCQPPPFGGATRRFSVSLKRSGQEKHPIMPIMTAGQRRPISFHISLWQSTAGQTIRPTFRIPVPDASGIS